MQAAPANFPLKISAPAKVNLCLYVGATRSDGLHEIISLFQSVSLFDEIAIAISEGGRDEVICPAVEGENIVTAALAALRAGRGEQFPYLEVEIEKKIPLAAGLGGGSADAAAILRAVSSTLKDPLDGERLAEIAMSVGADIPSQLEPGLTLVTGAGEQVELLSPLPEFGLVLIADSEGLSTKDVYRSFEQDAGPSRENLFATKERLRHIRAISDLEQESNDLQAEVERLRPSTDEKIDALLAAGAVAARVTGSGPTVFGLFPSYAQAVAALPKLEPFEVYAVRPITADRRTAS